MIVVAHAGHWAVQLLYAAPLVIMVVLLLIGRIRQQHKPSARREGRQRPGMTTMKRNETPNAMITIASSHRAPRTAV